MNVCDLITIRLWQEVTTVVPSGILKKSQTVPPGTLKSLKSCYVIQVKLNRERKKKNTAAPCTTWHTLIYCNNDGFPQYIIWHRRMSSVLHIACSFSLHVFTVSSDALEPSTEIYTLHSRRQDISQYFHNNEQEMLFQDQLIKFCFKVKTFFVVTDDGVLCHSVTDHKTTHINRKT